MNHALPDASASDYVKIPCSLADSPLFREAPYSRFKLWIWLLMEAAHVGSAGNRGLGAGRIDHSIRVIQEALAWEDTVKQKITTPGLPTIMRDLKILKERGQIEIESVRGIGTVITICNWEHYQGSKGEGEQEHFQEPTSERKEEIQEDPANASSSKDMVSKKKSSRKKNRQEADAEWREEFLNLGRDFPEAVSIYREEWMPHVPIRRSVKDSFQAKSRILNTLRLMHTQDGLPWEKIREIVRYCAQVSYPQGIVGSPAKLRQPVQDGSMKFWERTEQVMEADKREAQGKEFTNERAIQGKTRETNFQVEIAIID